MAPVTDHWTGLIGRLPQDIEFAVARPTTTTPPRLVVLQARPETTWRAREEERLAAAQATVPSYLSMIHSVATRVGGAS